MKIKEILSSVGLSYEKIQKVLKGGDPYEILFVKSRYEQARINYLTTMIDNTETVDDAYQVLSDYRIECSRAYELTENLLSNINVPEVDIKL